MGRGHGTGPAIHVPTMLRIRTLKWMSMISTKTKKTATGVRSRRGKPAQQQRRRPQQQQQQEQQQMARPLVELAVRASPYQMIPRQHPTRMALGSKVLVPALVHHPPSKFRRPTRRSHHGSARQPAKRLVSPSILLLPLPLQMPPQERERVETQRRTQARHGRSQIC